MRRYSWLFILLFCLTPWKGRAQVLKPLGKGLPYKVECACRDSLNKTLFVFTKSQFADTILLYTWDTTTNTWNGYATLKGTFGNVLNKATCQFINGHGITVTGVNPGSNHTYIYNYSISNAQWSPVASVSHQGGVQDYPFGEIKSFKLLNKVYYVGHFDSFAGIPNPGIIEYDGATFKKTGMVTTPLAPTFNLDARNDSLFFAKGNVLYTYQKDSGKWYPYYTLTKGNILGFGIDGGKIYMNGNGKIRWINYEGKLDSLLTGINRPVYSRVSNRLLIGDRPPANGPGVQGIFNVNTSAKTTEPLMRFSTYDSTSLRFIDIGSHVYVYGKQGIRYNGVDYNNIAELDNSSLTPQKVDSVLVWIFRDNNFNGVYDATDTGQTSYVAETNTGLQYLSDPSGKISFNPLNNEDLKFQFLREAVDSCYKSPFSGATGSRHYNNLSKGSDTVFIPVQSPSQGSANFVVNSYATKNARLNQFVKLKFRVFNRDCKTDSSDVTLNISLDTAVQFMGASPSYSSRSGNKLTYNMRLNPKVPKEFEVTVLYPNTKFSLNQVVKHYAMIKSQVKDDTADNVDSIVQVMVYSYDPNCKHSVPEGRITTGLDRVRYIIEFQNEGNADAWKIRVVDTLNLKMPVYEFRMIAASHPYSVSHRGNEITWMFDNINLKPKSVDDEGSKGYLIFDAMLKSDLRLGDSIINNAFIYFDYNKPVVTNNNVIVRRDDQGSIPFQSKTSNLSLYPNPGSGHITLENKTAIARTIYLYDAKGSLMGQMWVGALDRVTLNTSGWATGIYVAADHLGQSQTFVIE